MLALRAGCGFGLLVLQSAVSMFAAEPTVSFDKDIQPFLQARCVKCHSDTKRSGGLSVVTGADLSRGGESGPAIVPGKPDESHLYELIHLGEMPPKGNEPLTKDEIERIRRWIVEGAKHTGSDVTAPIITEQQITPLMLLRCTACHGGRRKEADLDLRTKAGMLRGGKSGPAAVPGKPEESLMVRRIHAEEMPPRRQLVSVSVKVMESHELKRLEEWIAAGMPEATTGPDIATTDPDRLVTDEDRQFWAFQPPRDIPPPAMVDVSIRNPVDAFILEKLRDVGLSLAPEADRVTLIRRLSFDLRGLPPTIEEIEAFITDPDPAAYENLVEQWLASPHYGSRWGRHWLDVAGYADSEGSQNEDRVRPEMWRYRDYVIRAFNADKPYDRFLQEQLAGDELADYEHAPEITPEIYDNLVATGFLRTVPDRTFANITNFVPDRLEVIADEIQVLGSAVMGLTLHCARCHTHKFDPLPQRDYYRLSAALKDALDEHDWIGPETRQIPFVASPERAAWKQLQQQIDEQITPLKQRVEAETDDAAKKKLQSEIQAIEKQRRPEPMIRALWSRGEPSPTYVLKRGNYLTAGIEVGPGVPSVLTDGRTPLEITPPRPGAKSTGRRLALARWLTEPNHPLTARVLVNRVWKHHFGTGLVTTPGNFGKTGSPPSHPDLLDWLARDFVRQGWSLKALHRLLMTSSAYRQSSQVTSVMTAADPDNRLLSRMPLRRLEAEIVRDALLSVAGQLNDTPFGPADDVDVRGDGLVTAKGASVGGRRSVFVLHRRTKLPTILESFDSPQMGPNCLERGESIVAPQALHLLNNATVHTWAKLFAERIIDEAGPEPAVQLSRLHRVAMGVPLEGKALSEAVADWEALRQQWRQTLADQPDADNEAKRRALQNYCHAIMNSAAFLYVD